MCEKIVRVLRVQVFVFDRRILSRIAKTMFDLIDFMQWTGLSTLAVVVYVLAFNSVKSSGRRTGPYSVPSEWSLCSRSDFNWNYIC